MNDRTVIVHEEPVYRETRVVDDAGASSNALIFGIIAVIAIVIIGLFVWQPWTGATSSSTTVTTQGQPPADTSNGSSSTTTTTTTSNGQSSTTTTNP